MSQRVLVSLLLWFLLPGCAAVGARGLCPEKGGRPWFEARSPHFLVRTNLEAGAAEKTALELERSRRALTLAFGRGFDPKGVVDVYVVRNQFELDEFSPGALSGMALRGPDGVTLVMKGEGYLVADAPSVDQLQLHELAHYLSGYALLRQPRWFAEGLAQYLETLQLAGDEQSVQIGRADKNSYVYVQLHGRVDFEELWAWDLLTETRQAQMQAYYASSWVWVHFLMNQHPQRFSRFQAGLARAEDPKAAWARAFGDVSIASLNAELNNYQKSGRYTVLSVPLPQDKPAIKVRPLEDAEVHVVRAKLFGMLSPQNTEQIAVELAEAGRLDPTGLATVELTTDADPQSLVTRLRGVLAHHPKDPAVWRALSRAMSAHAEGDPAEREAAMRQAVTTNPDHPGVHNNLAWFLIQQQKAQEAVAFAARAVQLAPWASHILDTHALALARTGKCADAVLLQKRAVDMLGERASAGTRLDYLERLATFEKGCAAVAAD